MATRSAAVKEVETKIEKPKAEAPKKEAKTPRPPIPRTSRFKDDLVITLLLDYNPKRPGTTGHSHFECYEDGMTVGEFLAAGGTRPDLAWDEKHSFIKIAEEFDESVEKKSRPEPKAKKAKAAKADGEAAPAKTAKTAAPAAPAKPVAKKAKPAPVVEEEEEEEEEEE